MTALDLRPGVWVYLAVVAVICVAAVLLNWRDSKRKDRRYTGRRGR